MTLSQADQSLLAEVKRMHRSDDCMAFLTRYMDQGADPNAKPEQGEGALEILLNPAIKIHTYKRVQALQLMVERGGNLLAHGPKLLALLEEDHTAVNFILPAMRERQEKSGIAWKEARMPTPPPVQADRRVSISGIELIAGNMLTPRDQTEESGRGPFSRLSSQAKWAFKLL